MTRFACGLVIGKFCPLHLGHELLIETALARCDSVVVISYTRPEFAHCEPPERRRWFAKRFSSARFERLQWIVLDEASPIPPNDAPDALHRRFCGEQCVAHFGVVPDAVFTSEAYGPGFAQALSQQFNRLVTHVAVDPDRVRVPVSATRLRADPFAHRAWVAPEVFAGLVPRIALLGGESSGKTTLAQALAAQPGFTLAAEYGRELWVKQGGRLDYDDHLHIARTQIDREESVALAPGTQWVICDSTSLTTLFYCLKDFGRAPPELNQLARRHYNLVVLCEPDFDFVQDGTRRDDSFRWQQHAWYLDRLADREPRVLRVGGTVEERLRAVLARVEGQVSAPAWLA